MTLPSFNFPASNITLIPSSVELLWECTVSNHTRKFWYVWLPITSVLSNDAWKFVSLVTFLLCRQHLANGLNSLIDRGWFFAPVARSVFVYWLRLLSCVRDLFWSCTLLVTENSTMVEMVLLDQPDLVDLVRLGFFMVWENYGQSWFRWNCGWIYEVLISGTKRTS